MYKHILLPTDGSALSQQAVANGVLFAKNIGATIVAVYVVPQPHPDQLETWMHHDANFADRRQSLFEKFADQHLSYVANSALAEEVPCTCKLIRAKEPHLGILKAAEQSHCDLIYMASHGWKGDTMQLLGSETLKVLINCKIPVLVHKPVGGI